MLLGAEGEQRQQFLGGEPFSRAPPRRGDARRSPPPRLVVRAARRLGAARRGRRRRHGGARLAPAARRPRLRFDVERLPLSDGRFHLRFGLADAAGEHLYHWLDDALQFVVYPAGDERGSSGSRERGRWRIAPLLQLASDDTRTCPDWPELMEIAPDLQFKHYTVAEAKLPSEVLVASTG